MLRVAVAWSAAPEKLLARVAQDFRANGEVEGLLLADKGRTAELVMM